MSEPFMRMHCATHDREIIVDLPIPLSEFKEKVLAAIVPCDWKCKLYVKPAQS